MPPSIKSYIIKNTNFLDYDIWLLDQFFGFIPLEISEIFPLSQYVSYTNLPRDTLKSKIQEYFSIFKDLNFKEINIVGNLSLINELLKFNDIFSKSKINVLNVNITNEHEKKIEDLLGFLT